jgi:hypothetical protein
MISHIESSSVFWFDNINKLQNIKNPFEIISRFGVQNGVNIKDKQVAKKVLKAGLRYRKEDDEPVYVIVMQMEIQKKMTKESKDFDLVKRIHSGDSQVGKREKMFIGLEYLPRRDGMFFEEGNCYNAILKIKIFIFFWFCC